LLLMGFVMTQMLPRRLSFRPDSVAVQVPDGNPFREDPLLAVLVYPAGFSSLTLIVVGLLSLVIFWCIHAFFMWFVRTFQARREQAAARAAWARHGATWLGLFSPLDEALSGTQSTVGFYVPKLVRLPWPGWPPPPPRTWHGRLFYGIRLVFWFFIS